MSEPGWDCVMERQPIPGQPMERIEVWHVAMHRGRTEDFTPIRCSRTGEGITLPSGIVRRVPTCSTCRAIVGLDRG